MMNKKLFFYFILFGSMVMATAQESDFDKAVISFEFVAKKVKGTISGFTSNSRIDWEQLGNSYFEGSVATKTLDTDNGLRNWSLKSRKYFNKNAYPRIYFKSNKVTQQGSELVVEGTLTLKGIKKPWTIVFKKDVDGILGTATLYSYDFGIKIKKKREDNLVKVTFKFTK